MDKKLATFAETIDEERSVLRKAIFEVTGCIEIKDDKSIGESDYLKYFYQDSIRELMGDFGAHKYRDWLDKSLLSVLEEDFNDYDNVRKFLVYVLQLEDNPFRKLLKAVQLKDLNALEDYSIRDTDSLLDDYLINFDDLVLLDDRSLQKIMRNLEVEDLSVALSGQSFKVKEKFYRNMSKRMVIILRDEIDKIKNTVTREKIRSGQAFIKQAYFNLLDNKAVFNVKGKDDDKPCF